MLVVVGSRQEERPRAVRLKEVRQTVAQPMAELRKAGLLMAEPATGAATLEAARPEAVMQVVVMQEAAMQGVAKLEAPTLAVATPVAGMLGAPMMPVEEPRWAAARLAESSARAMTVTGSTPLAVGHSEKGQQAPTTAAGMTRRRCHPSRSATLAPACRTELVGRCALRRLGIYDEIRHSLRVD